MQAKLIPVGGGPAIPILNDVTVVGRKRGLCDLIVERGSVSKLHCLIVKTDGLLFIRDLGSTNGTKVNGQRVTRGALLPGDELAFASARFRVHLGPGEPEPAYDERTEMLTVWPGQGGREPPEEAVSDAEIDADGEAEFLPLAEYAEEDEEPSQLKSVPEQLESLPDEQLESLPEDDFPPEPGGDSESDVRLLSDDSID